ncbi:hypothetical protein ACWDAZ_42075, partial [Streptomyces sp. NPDC001215]
RHVGEPLADDDHRALGAQGLGGPYAVLLQADIRVTGVDVGDVAGQGVDAVAASRPGTGNGGECAEDA